jgi:hypothetical protein
MTSYAEGLQSHTRQPIYKIEFMDSNEITIDEIIKYEIGGNISIERKNGMRRTCNLTLDNSSGLFTPSSSGLVSISNKVKVYTGLKIDNIDYYNQRGVFVLGNPRMTKNNSGEKIIVLEMYDKFALLDGTVSGTLEAEYIIPIGEPIQQAVIDLAIEAGITTPVMVYPTNVVTPYTLTVSAGDTFATIFYKYAEMLTWEVFFDQYGALRFQPPTNEDTQSTTWEFAEGDTLYISSVHNFEWNKIRNYVAVTGDNVNGDIAHATASNENIFSDTYVGKIGKRTEVLQDEIIDTDALALTRALYEVQLNTQIQETADVQAIPVDIINEGDIVILDDPENAFNRDRYVVNTINYPLTNGQEMSLNLMKARLFQPNDAI